LTINDNTAAHTKQNFFQRVKALGKATYFFLEKSVLKVMSFIPILDTVANFPRSVTWGSFKQFLFLWFFASIPLMLTFGDAYILQNTSLKAFLSDSINSQKLFIYSSTFIAPMFFNLSKYYGKEREYDLPSVYWISLTSLAVLLISAFTFVRTDYPAYLLVNLVLYGLSVLIWYISIADDNLTMPDIYSSSNESADEFIGEAGERVSKK